MKPVSLLGIDIGTTATKIILVDTQGNILSEVSRPATLHSPQANWAEEDPDEWWNNVCQVIPECLAAAGRQGSQVEAIGVSGMVPTTILVSGDGQSLRRSIQQNDARSHVEIDYFKAHTDAQAVFRRTGSAITQQSIGPKLHWIAQNQPDLLPKTKWVMGSYDYINYKLTGIPVLERNWALESGLYDLHRLDWDDELLTLANIRREQLPPVFNPSQLVGGVHAGGSLINRSERGDTGRGRKRRSRGFSFFGWVKNNGDLLVKLGGAGDILYSLDRLELDERLFIDYHVIPGLFLINGCMASSGSIIKWFRNSFAPDYDYSELDAEAEKIPAGSDGLVLLPYFIGEKTPIFDPLARGLLFGLTLQHSRAHIYHAILEGISFGFYHHLQVLNERGFEVKMVRVANGGARSMLWRQVTSDVIGYPLEEVAHHPGSSLGAAFVAGMGVKAFRDWGEIEKYILIEAVTQPNMERHAKYLELFKLYRELYESNISNFRSLASIEGVTQV